MSRPIFEVIATCVDDAVAAVEGGADRLELAGEMSADGLTVDVAEFRRIRAAVDVPLRVMLRQQDGFLAGDLPALCARARELRAAGADAFVLGFLDRRGAVDLPAVTAVLDAIAGCPWTFHRALDNAADRAAARAAITGLPGLDAVLTAGSAAGVGAGLDVLRAEASAQTPDAPRLIAGGGLRLEHVAALGASGVDAFHVGTLVRTHGWASPVEVPRVRAWRDAVDATAPARA